MCEQFCGSSLEDLLQRQSHRIGQTSPSAIISNYWYFEASHLHEVSQNIWCGQNVDGIDLHKDNVWMIDRAQQLCRAVLNLFLHHEEQTVSRSFALGGVEMCSKDTEDDESRQRG